MNLNKVIIIGNLTRDPETRTTPSGQTVTNIGVATNRIYNDKNGQKQKQTEFHNIVLWGKLAEIASQYLSKGKSVMVEGRLQTRSWDAQDGSKRYKTEIVAEKMQLGPRLNSESLSTNSSTVNEPKFKETPARSETEEDIPIIEADSVSEEINVEEIPF